jgi:hypothetical protein
VLLVLLQAATGIVAAAQLDTVVTTVEVLTVTIAEVVNVLMLLLVADTV